ncbi:DUF3080 domain-containing protein [Oceanimonas sp. CHS3-5]|uniref:DUF3080 domain-containing protein n=1 Tax=Oceanimonas sp. CHS3-5 TaxID=3068186 RepID=UPI00273DE6D7|nr:DUF3080 domain-containing protein [Oceanimonas sp. CHS3-5]MDP5291915.1 DUF3080 domain-containing protein [Oceanimonas sp. CHS3-5]
MKGSIIAITLACLWLTGCNDRQALKSAFDTYLARVANVLGTDPPALGQPAPLPPLPAQRRLQLQQPRISAGLLDTLKLGECRLLALVGEHNSPIGKSQSAGAVLLYHLRFQQGLQDCRAQQDDNALQAWLTGLEQQKAPLLPGYHWNMMVAEPDIRAALTPRQRPVPDDHRGFQATFNAFSLFARLRHQAAGTPQLTVIDSAGFNERLGGLYNNDYLGELYYSLHSASHYLAQSITFLGRLEQFNCGPAGKADAERLRNAMEHYYIKDIQARLSRLDRHFVRLAPLLQQSLTPPSTGHDAMDEYRHWYASGLDSLIYTRYRQLTLEHARAWQDFLHRCNLSPG